MKYQSKRKENRRWHSDRRIFSYTDYIPERRIKERRVWVRRKTMNINGEV